MHLNRLGVWARFWGRAEFPRAALLAPFVKGANFSSVRNPARTKKGGLKKNVREAFVPVQTRALLGALAACGFANYFVVFRKF
jgi:hypothetical protein